MVHMNGNVYWNAENHDEWTSSRWMDTYKYGEDWFIHFQDKGPYGRVCHLQPVDWSSGWPVMGNAGEPYWKFRKPKSDSKTIVNPVETDEFDSSNLVCSGNGK